MKLSLLTREAILHAVPDAQEEMIEEILSNYKYYKLDSKDQLLMYSEQYAKEKGLI